MEENSELNGNYINNTVRTSPYSRIRSHSLTHSTSFESINRKGTPPPIPRRDIGVTCSVLTRNIGVGHQHPNTKSVATITLNGEIHDGYGDKWFNEKIKFLSGDNQLSQSYINEVKKPIVITKGTQTTLAKEKKDFGSQTTELKVQKTYDSFTQTLEIKKVYHNTGILASVVTKDTSTQTSVPTNTVGVSDHTINDILCSKCISEKNKLNKQNENNLSDQMSTISLASLTVPRSKSFNLGEDKLNLRSRTVGCQYESCISHKACQYESKTQSKACQNDLKLSHKAIQYESFTLSKNTDTKDLDPGKKHVACNTKDTKIETAEAVCNTIHTPEKTTPCIKCSKKEKEDVRKDDNAMPSRIPRPQIPTTPVENKKFRRQDTYTKIPSSANEASG